jgi:hypothetical protein
MNVVFAFASSAAQGPSAAIKLIAAFGPAPASPPVATRYTWSPAWQLYNPLILKLPSAPLTTGCDSIVRGADPVPVFPAA